MKKKSKVKNQKQGEGRSEDYDPRIDTWNIPFENKKKKVWHIRLWKEDKYFVITLDRPRVTTQGKSISDALRMLAEAYEIQEDNGQAKGG